MDQRARKKGDDVMTDDELVQAWESLALPYEQWTHRSHVRVAFTYLTRHPGPRATADDPMPVEFLILRSRTLHCRGRDKWLDVERMARTYQYEFEIPPSAIDANGHANNVEFVRWMQDAAVAHADAAGCTAATSAAGATWVVRSHRIEYRRPAFAGERVRVVTWVENVRRAFSLRRYRFERAANGEVLAEGETDWVFVDVTTGRPRSVPEAIMATFDAVDVQEPLQR